MKVGSWSGHWSLTLCTADGKNRFQKKLDPHLSLGGTRKKKQGQRGDDGIRGVKRGGVLYKKESFPYLISNVTRSDPLLKTEV